MTIGRWICSAAISGCRRRSASSRSRLARWPRIESRATMRPSRFSRASPTRACSSRSKPSRNVMSSKSWSQDRRRAAVSSWSELSVTKRRAGLSISRAPRRMILSNVTADVPTALDSARPREDRSAGRRARGAVLPLTQELKELDALAHPAAQNGRALQHLPHELGDLARPEEEGSVELFLHLEDVLVRQMRIFDGRDLEAVVGDQVARFVAQPALPLGLVVEIRSR